jgi:hypothetical protein
MFAPANTSNPQLMMPTTLSNPELAGSEAPLPPSNPFLAALFSGAALEDLESGFLADPNSELTLSGDDRAEHTTLVHLCLHLGLTSRLIRAIVSHPGFTQVNEVSDERGETCLHVAVRGRQKGVVYAILERFDFNGLRRRDRRGKEPVDLCDDELRKIEASGSGEQASAAAAVVSKIRSAIERHPGFPDADTSFGSGNKTRPTIPPLSHLSSVQPADWWAAPGEGGEERNVVEKAPAAAPPSDWGNKLSRFMADAAQERRGEAKREHSPSGKNPGETTRRPSDVEFTLAGLVSSGDRVARARAGARKGSSRGRQGGQGATGGDVGGLSSASDDSSSDDDHSGLRGESDASDTDDDPDPLNKTDLMLLKHATDEQLHFVLEHRLLARLRRQDDGHFPSAERGGA